ncbi:MAG TPA: S41 family peptidase [Opitutaceae bacterium]|nr:S41 family peptidase [Opitutaceae bacterium]
MSAFVTCRPVARCLRGRVAVPVLALALFVLAGCATLPKARVDLTQFPPAQRVRAERNIAVFDRVWDLVNRKHYEPKTHGVDWEQAAAVYGPKAAAAPNETELYAVLNEMLAELHDSHTHALTARQWTEYRTRERIRTGFSMIRVEDQWVVSDVLPASPAAVAGVKSGWLVVARNGQPLGERPNFTALEGEEVAWNFVDDHDRAVHLVLKAQRLSIAPLQVVRELPGGYLYLRFDEFDALDRRWLGRELARHRSAPGVIIDLRRNPGGGTWSLGFAVGEFFDEPVNCGTFITRNGARSVENSAEFGSAHYRGPVVVLVDASTASAAEIFTAVLKAYHRATIVGRKTAGAVLASWFYHLPDGGELQLSGEDYVAPNGHRIEGNGVVPDITVQRTLADVRAGRDPDLKTALRVFESGKAETLKR